MRFHFHQRVRQLIAVGIAAIGARIEALNARAFDHRGIIGIRNHRTFRMQLMGIADHAEQRDRLLLIVYHPIRIENLVAAMFGVRLCKHH